MQKHIAKALQVRSQAIQNAIEDSDAFVACFSSAAIVKKGQFQAELRHALYHSRRLPLDASFLIPARLDDCALPARLADRVQYVDLFPDWSHGIRKLVRALRRAARTNRQGRPRLVPFPEKI